MEIDDFNQLFRNETFIDDKFGKTIKVQLEHDNKINKLNRVVKERQELIKFTEQRKNSSEFSAPTKNT